MILNKKQGCLTRLRLQKNIAKLLKEDKMNIK